MLAPARSVLRRRLSSASARPHVLPPLRLQCRFLAVTFAFRLVGPADAPLGGGAWGWSEMAYSHKLDLADTDQSSTADVFFGMPCGVLRVQPTCYRRITYIGGILGSYHVGIRIPLGTPRSTWRPRVRCIWPVGSRTRCIACTVGVQSMTDIHHADSSGPCRIRCGVL